MYMYQYANMYAHIYIYTHIYIEMEIKEAFKTDNEEIEINSQDGTFYMKVEDWYERFTSLFIATNFPPSWVGKRTKVYMCY
jgi:hypothetical protein